METLGTEGFKRNGSSKQPIDNGFDNSEGLTENAEAVKRASYEFGEIVSNVLLSRDEFIKKFFDPRRDYDKECGYPAARSNIPADLYRDLYDREPIACRVVQLMPKESWQSQPSVYETGDSETDTKFEKAWDGLSSSVRGKSWHQDEKGSVIWEYLRRADIMSGIGTFGIMLLGLDDGNGLQDPVPGAMSMVEGPLWPNGTYADTAPIGTDSQYQGVQLGYTPVPPKKKGQKLNLLFIRVFDETMVQPVRYESNPMSPRFGQPVMYMVTFNDPRDNHTGIGLPIATKWVHWSRIIHLADNLNSSESFGPPRMKAVLNRILDLIKLYGGSAEMYWRGAFPGLSIETNPQLGGTVNVDLKKVRSQVSDYQNGLQRFLGLIGMTAKTLAPTVVDPTAQIETQLQAICIQLGCPKRVFMGSERGELASSQDDASWNDRLRDRQNSYLTPRVIVPFIDRLIAIGVLPEPKGYTVEWPDLEALGDAEKAAIGLQRTQALAAYTGGGLLNALGLKDFYVQCWGLTDEAAQALVDNANEDNLETLATPPDPNAEQGTDIGGENNAQASDQQTEDNPDEEQEDGEETTKNQENFYGWKNEILTKFGLVANYNPHQARDSHGRFGSGGGVTTKHGDTLHPVSYVDYKTKTLPSGKVVKHGGKWADEQGNYAPEHIQKMAIPPAWTKVHVNANAKGDLLARGEDAKGRVQMKYGATHNVQAAMAKFGRVKELRKKRQAIFKEIDRDAKKPSLKENAECLKTILHTGIRPGSEKDTHTDYKSFGATTLEGKHVKDNGDGTVTLKFATGKNKGREVEFPVHDKATSEMLLKRSKEAGPDGKLFHTDADSLRGYSKTKDGGGFKTKDHRTALGTEVAIQAIKEHPTQEFKSMKEYKAAVKTIATRVANTLGNTPTVALSSYIDPTVFAGWKPPKVTSKA
jgi:DNA topoisomerase IB